MSLERCLQAAGEACGVASWQERPDLVGEDGLLWFSAPPDYVLCVSRGRHFHWSVTRDEHDDFLREGSVGGKGTFGIRAAINAGRYVGRPRHIKPSPTRTDRAEAAELSAREFVKLGAYSLASEMYDLAARLLREARNESKASRMQRLASDCQQRAQRRRGLRKVLFPLPSQGTQAR